MRSPEKGVMIPCREEQERVWLRRRSGEAPGGERLMWEGLGG